MLTEDKDLIKDEQYLVNYVTDRFNKAQAAREGLSDDWENYHKLYKNQHTGDESEAHRVCRSKLFFPKVMTAINTASPIFISPFLNNEKPFITALPREQTDIDNAKIVTDLLMYITDVCNFGMRMIPFWKQFLMYGTAFVKITWKFKDKYDDPWIESLNLFDCFLDPDASNLEDARFFIQRSFVDMDYLIQKEKDGTYINVDKIGSKYNSNKKTTDINNTDVVVRNQDLSNSIVAEDDGDRESTDSDLIEIWEYWEDDRVIHIADRSVVLSAMDNPFAHGKKPFVMAKYNEDPFEPYGIGMIEPIASLQLETNHMRNLAIDSKNRSVYQMYTCKKSTWLDLKKNFLQWEMDRIIPTQSTDDLVPLKTNQMVGLADGEADRIDREISLAVGISDYMAGTAQPKSNVPAYAVNSQISQSTQRFDIPQKVGLEAVKDMFQMILSLCRQYMNDKKVIRILNNGDVSFKDIFPDNIVNEFDLRIKVDPTGQLQIEEQKQSDVLIQLHKGNPAIDQTELTKRNLEAHNINNIQQLMTKQAPMAPQMPGQPNIPGQPNQPQQTPPQLQQGGM